MHAQIEFFISLEWKIPRFLKRWDKLLINGRHNILFILSCDFLDQSDDTLYRIIILWYSKTFSYILFELIVFVTYNSCYKGDNSNMFWVSPVLDFVEWIHHTCTRQLTLPERQSQFLVEVWMPSLVFRTDLHGPMNGRYYKRLPLFTVGCHFFKQCYYFFWKIKSMISVKTEHLDDFKLKF